MNRKIIALVLFTGIAALRGAAQTDSVSMLYVKNALYVNHNCEAALHLLDMISESGRKDAEYFLCMGKVHDCKMNKEQAIYYYGKYLEQKPADDSVKRRVAELKDMNGYVVTNSANEARVAKAAKQQNSLKHKKKKRSNLYDNYASIGLGYMAGPGSDAPYKQGISFNASDGFPIIHNKAVIDINIYGDFLFGANKDWYTRAFGLTPGSAVNPGLGYYDMLTIGLAPVIFNKKNSSLTAGAFGGINFIMLGTPNDATYNAPTYSSPLLFTFTYGVKVNYYLGESVLFFLQLNMNTANSVSVDSYVGTMESPANFTTLNVGVAYKFSSFWYW